MEGKGKNNLVIHKENFTLSMSRTFNATKDRVWKAYTTPELVKQWWSGVPGEMIIDKMDVKVGGIWRYIQKEESGEYAFNGKYTEIIENEVLAYTFEFELIPGHICEERIVFEEKDGKTTLFSTTTFANLEDLEGMVESGMESGAVTSWNKLQNLVESMQ